jgi:hypothetical protein
MHHTYMMKYAIPQPCQEDWNKMTPTLQGAFCSSCQKTVIDFTKLSDDEVLNYLNENIHNKICGRIEVKQLERINLYVDANILYSNISLWKKYLAIILICFGSMIMSCNNNEQVGNQIKSINYNRTKILNQIPKKDSIVEHLLIPKMADVVEITQDPIGVIAIPEPEISIIAGGIGAYHEVINVDTLKNKIEINDTIKICKDTLTSKLDSSTLYSYSKQVKNIN